MDKTSRSGWKGPTVREIADLAGVGTASVDRVLNNRPGVKEKTRNRVMDALQKLGADSSSGAQHLDIRLFCESGATFNGAMALAEERVNRSYPGIRITSHFVSTNELDPLAFARKIELDGEQSAGVVLVAREHPAINSAVRKLMNAGVPVICLTTDLPSSRRAAYVGNDQYAAGSVAAQLIGQILPTERNSILLMMSVSFRSQQDREMGFRRVLRTEFPHLKIEERVMSDDQPETTKEQLMNYLSSKGCPAAIYNVAGANRGVADALKEFGADTSTVFVGHELTDHSRALLVDGVMDYVISHDFTQELRGAVELIESHARGVTIEPSPTQILVHTRYNCE